MAILTLQQLLPLGETQYIAKHNSNYAAIQASVNALHAQLMSANGVAVSAGFAFEGLFGARSAFIGSTSYLHEIDGVDNDILQTSFGYFWDVEAKTVVRLSSTFHYLSFASAIAGTYRVNINASGEPEKEYYGATWPIPGGEQDDLKLTNTAFLVNWSGTAFTNIVRFAAVIWDGADIYATKFSTALADPGDPPVEFDSLDDRLENIEESLGGVTVVPQPAGHVYAGPASGADATPTFRALVADDIPGLGTAAALDIDTDVNLAANSDTKLATQKAVKTYVDAAVAAASSSNADFSFTSDTGSTADSDPGSGLFKWNNATQASSTFIYVDEVTADAVNLDTYMAELAAGSTVHIVQGDDDTKWQEWRLTTTPVDGTGYWKLAVSLLASGGNIADGKACSLRFDNVGASSLADGSVTNATLADMATQSIKGRTTAGTGDPEDLTAAQAAAVLQGDGSSSSAAGFRGLPVNSQTGNYTLVLSDVGKTIRHPSGGGAGDTFTIAAQASVTWPDGAAITFENRDSNALSIAITTDTLRLAGTGTTGTRTLAQYGIATAVFDDAINEWLISGTGLT